jgi:hypothetical protein
LGLAQRLVENHPKRQTSFNRQIRVTPLSARRRSARRRPQAKRIFADPNRQITALSQAFVVLRPVGYLMHLLGDVVTTIGVEFVRHLQYPEKEQTASISAEGRSMLQRLTRRIPENGLRNKAYQRLKAEALLARKVRVLNASQQLVFDF